MCVCCCFFCFIDVNSPGVPNLIEAPEPAVVRDPETPVQEDNPILTPQAPAIAFPLANPPVAPQPKEEVCHLGEGTAGESAWLQKVPGPIPGITGNRIRKKELKDLQLGPWRTVTS